MDGNGIKLYGIYMADPELYTGDLFFNPPLLLMPNNPEIGTPQVSYSTYLMNIPGYPPVTVNVTSTTTVLGLEDVQTVNKVLKDCVKVSMRLDAFIVELQQYIA